MSDKFNKMTDFEKVGYLLGETIRLQSKLQELEEQNKVLVEALEVYASALNLPEESALGEPNQDPYSFPARLGTRARQALDAYEAWKRGEK